MPFDDRITNGMTPHRVYALCKLVHFFQYEEKKDVSKDEVSNFLQPPSINTGKTQFKEVFGFAENGQLISETSTKLIKTELSKKDIASSDQFRRVIIKKAIERTDLMFWKFTSWYIMRDSKVLNERPKELQIAFDQEINIDKSPTFIYNDTNINGWRTWAVYLGYGYLHDGVVIPNVANRLEDLFMENTTIPQDKFIPFKVFMQWLNSVAPELDGGLLSNMYRGKSQLQSQQLSLGLSSALRALHDQKFIEIQYIHDALDTWFLTKSPYHEISEQVSQIMIRSEKL